MKKYRYVNSPFPDRILFVGRGLGDVYIVCYLNPKGRRRRFRSKFLPPVKTAEECQENLDDYAAKNGLAQERIAHAN